MKKKTKITVAAVAVAIATIAATIYVIRAKPQELRIATREAAVGTVEVTVMATGYVQPVDKVDIGTQVSGVIEKIYVDFNSHVKRGQLLAELDKMTLRENVSQAEATLASALADQTYAQQTYDRTKLLYEAKAATDVAYEEAVNRLSQAKMTVTKAQANLHQSRVNLGYADITSPIDGVVLNRAVEQGQTVAASFSTPTLFTIANDLKRMQVEADVDEADIGKVKPGQAVSFTVDAYADDVFGGTVSQVRLQPVVTNNVVTYTVIVEAPNPDEKLFPGMTANIIIVTQSETGLVVPMEALSCTFSPAVMKKLHFAPPTQAAPPTGAPPTGTPTTGAPTTGITPAGALTAKTVWVQKESGIVSVPIKTGIADGVSVIVEDGIQEGDKVILSATIEVKGTNSAAAANPLMPRPPGRR
ncbi:MAG: efflux RND transporter periplasmic adaptor subunit [Prevotellaceae bacterium]|jgi:HlyD family secretion protein|nr:efflux RND transporter periplasmic adaptor subunit [Prevotellaceae bacterium]